MEREFIHSDIGEFGFTHFYLKENDKWTFIDLEVDCDTITDKNFKENDSLTLQFWINENKEFCIASKIFGHKRQANIPLAMLEKVKVTFTEPAKGGGEFDLSIDSEKFRGEIIHGEINVEKKKDSWDMQAYKTKREKLEGLIVTILRLTGGTVTKRNEYINV